MGKVYQFFNKILDSSLSLYDYLLQKFTFLPLVNAQIRNNYLWATPNYPNNYSNNVFAGEIIRFDGAYLLELYIYGETEHYYDYIYFNGEALSGFLDIQFDIYGDTLNITFISDAEVSRYGVEVYIYAYYTIQELFNEQIELIPGNYFSFYLDEDITFYNPDGYTLSFEVFEIQRSQITINSLPNWLQFDGQSVTFYGTPALYENVEYNITIRAFDEEYGFQLIDYLVLDLSPYVIWSTPNYPENYDDYVFIADNIILEGAQSLKVEMKGITELDYDNIIINGQFYSGQLEQTIEIQGDQLDIQFQSDVASNYQGVQMTIKAKMKPYTGLTLQEQYDSQIGILVTDQSFVIQFEKFVFNNTQGHDLNYTISEIKQKNGQIVNQIQWIQLISSNRTIVGQAPQFEDQFQLTITGINIDLNYEISQNLTMIINNPPQINLNAPSLQRQFDDCYNGYRIQVGFLINFQIQEDSFTDSAGDQLSYSLVQVNENQKIIDIKIQNEIQKAQWISFNSQTLTLFGTPNQGQIGKTYEIDIIASDGYNYAKQTIQISVLEGIQDEFMRKYPGSKLEQNQQIHFQFNSFQENITHYEITNIQKIYLEQTKSLDQLPEWLKFDPIQRIFVGKVQDLDGVTYVLQIRGFGGQNDINDQLSFQVYINDGILDFELVSVTQIQNSNRQLQNFKSVVIQGVPYLISIFNLGLVTFDLTNPQSPVQVSIYHDQRIITANAFEILEIKGGFYGFIIETEKYYMVLNISNPITPTLISSSIANIIAYRILIKLIDENIYVIICSAIRLHFINMNDPSNPFEQFTFLMTNDTQLQEASSDYPLIGEFQEFENKIYFYYVVSSNFYVADFSNYQQNQTMQVYCSNISTFLLRYYNIVGLKTLLITQIQQIWYVIIVSDLSDHNSNSFLTFNLNEPEYPKFVIENQNLGFSRWTGILSIKEKTYILVQNPINGIYFHSIQNPISPLLLYNIPVFDVIGKSYKIVISKDNYIICMSAAGISIYKLKLNSDNRNRFYPRITKQIEEPQNQLYIKKLINYELKDESYIVYAYNTQLVYIDKHENIKSQLLLAEQQINDMHQFYFQNQHYGLLSYVHSNVVHLFLFNNTEVVQDIGYLDNHGIIISVNAVEINQQIYFLLSNEQDSEQHGMKIISMDQLQQIAFIEGHILMSVIMMIQEETLVLLADNSENNKGMRIINLSNPLSPKSEAIFQVQKPSIIGLTDIGKITYALLIDENTGLNIIDLSIVSNPTLVGNFNINFKCYSISTFYSNKEIYSIIAGGYFGYIVVKITNPYNPIQASSIENRYWQAVYSLPVQINQLTFGCLSYQESLYLVQFEWDKGMETLIASSVNDGVKEFNIQFLPVYTSTLDHLGEGISLISLQTITLPNRELRQLPTWVQVFLNEKYMQALCWFFVLFSLQLNNMMLFLHIYFQPPNKESLNQIMFIHYIYTTKIDSNAGIDSEAIIELRRLGYIDKFMFLTSQFDMYNDLNLGFGTDQYNRDIQHKLSKYYIEGYIEFQMNDFLNLNKAPIIQEGELQKQYDTNVGKTKVTQQIDFQFTENTFIDQDGDTLTYFVTNIQKTNEKGEQVYSQTILPDWMQFDGTTRRFIGRPKVLDLGEYTFTVRAFDQYEEVLQNFTISLTNNDPVVKGNIPKQFKSLKLGNFYEYILDYNLFEDIDLDVLTYEIQVNYIQQDTNQSIIKILEQSDDTFWLIYDPIQRKISGQPQQTDIYLGKEGYDQIFNITITATDIALKSASIQYPLQVYNYIPQINENITIQQQFDDMIQSKDIVLKIERKLDFVFHTNTFIGENLSYRLKLREQLSQRRSLQDSSFDISQNFSDWYEITQYTDFWLKFDGQNRRIYGIPQKENLRIYELKIIANNGYTEIDDIITLQITNKKPYINSPLQQQVIPAIINEPYSFQFNLNTYIDDDDDTLVYIAKLINGDPLPSWLIFKSNERKFEGTPINFDKVGVQLIVKDLADDTTSDEFYINVEMSMSYIVQQLGIYGGPLVGIFGLIKYRSSIHEIISKKNYQYNRQEKAIVGKKFNKNIYLIKKYLIMANQAWEQLKQQTISELKSNKQISFKEIQGNWIKLKFRNEKGEICINSIKQELQNLSDLNSIYRQSLYSKLLDGLIAKQLIKLDQKTNRIFHRIKKLCSNYYDQDDRKVQSPLDWYKKLIIKTEQDLFEDIKINNNALKSLINVNFTDKEQDQINYKLLMNTIIADAMGMDEIKTLEWQFSKGENILKDDQEIKVIQTKVKIQIFSFIDKIKLKLKFLKLDYVKIRMFDNSKLPKWLDLQLQNNKLSLSGIPDTEDIGEIMIQIIGVDDFIYREFFINVVENENYEDDSAERPFTPQNNQIQSYDVTFQNECVESNQNIKLYDSCTNILDSNRKFQERVKNLKQLIVEDDLEIDEPNFNNFIGDQSSKQITKIFSTSLGDSNELMGQKDNEQSAKKNISKQDHDEFGLSSIILKEQNKQLSGGMKYSPEIHIDENDIEEIDSIEQQIKD